jgi:hypothetical protein
MCRTTDLGPALHRLIRVLIGERPDGKSTGRKRTYREIGPVDVCNDPMEGSSQFPRRTAYPGGASRMRERRDILTRHARPVIFGCLRQGLRREAWTLYRATLAWNVSLGRIRYLAAFPVLAAISRLRAMTAPKARLAQRPGGR